MKNLIRTLSYGICMLLLTCTFCLAQSNKKGQIIAHDGNGEPVYELKSVGIDTIFVKLMIEYEIECYNDSTKKRVHINPGEPDILSLTEITSHTSTAPDICYSYGNGCANPSHYRYKWFHKQPTFADFVRWAAKKYGL